MSTTSANPTKLEGFVSGVRTAREVAETDQSSVASLSRTTIAACDGYVSVPALGALATLLDAMGENETFVSTVRFELLAADNHDGGTFTVSDTRLATALAAAGVGTPPEAVIFDPITIVGIPQTSGFVDDPICAANGNMVHQDIDLGFPGFASALTVDRTYNSVRHGVEGAFGSGWSSMFDVFLDVSRLSDPPVDRQLTAHLADGATVTFRPAPDGAGWVHDSRRVRSLEQGDGPARFVLHLDHERRLRFDDGGTLIGWEYGAAIVDVDRGDGRVVSLREERSGRRVEIEWQESASGAMLVARLLSSDGRRVSYRRDEAGRLVARETERGEQTYRWDAGRLLSVLDGDGVPAFVNVYDEAGRVLQQTSPFGRVTSYSYRFPGPTVITDERNVRQAMVHDGRGNLTAVIDVDGAAMRITYDDADRVVRVVGKSGAEWRYDYDAETGDLLRRHDPDGLSQSWTWDERGRRLTDTDRAGATTTFDYEADHRTPTRMTGPDGAVATAELDATGQPVVVTDPDGVVRRLSWDGDGQLLAVSNEVGATTRFEYDATGLMIRIIDPAGVETVLEYGRDRIASTRRTDVVSTYVRTAAGRISGGSEPGDLPWSATFGSHGALETITDAMGSTVRFEYDELGEITTVVAPDGARFRHEYDVVGRLIAAIDPTGATVRKGYDVEGRVIELIDADGGVMRRTLDVLGRTVESVAADGAVTRWTYHPNGEIATVTGPDGRVWTTEVDLYGRVVAVIDPSGGRTVRTFSPAGRLLARTSPAGRSERFEYDDAGRCVVVVGVDGVRRSMQLDERGNVTAMDLSAAESAGLEPAVTAGHTDMVWDEHGRMVGYRTAAGEGTYRWNAAGRLTDSVDPTGVATTYEWDQRGLLRSATDGAGASSVYSYDDRGRLSGQRAPGGRTTTWTYDIAGHVGAVTDPTGATTEFLRNGSGMVTGMRRGVADGPGHEGWDRTLDAVGRELSRTALDGSILGLYDYDGAGRMVSAVAPESGLFSTFLWDDTDHITTVTDASGTSTVERDADGWAVALTNQSGVRTLFDRDASGRVVAVRDGAAGEFRLPDDQQVRDPAGRLLIGPDGTLYRYDDAGRVAEVAPPDGAPTRIEYGTDGLITREVGPVGVREFTYDHAGRVHAIDVAGLGRTVIDYDAAGRRSTEIGPDGAVTTYRWNVLDQLVGIERIDAAGERTAISLDLDAIGRPQRINGELIGYDALLGLPNKVGDVRVLAAGVAAWRSDAAGWQIRQPDAADGVDVGAVVLLGARAYDPATRQFLSPDPLMTVPGTNGAASAYTYAWQDPVNFADPSGLRPISQEEYDAIRKMEEQGRLGQAWEAIKEDPWGTVAMVGVVALGVGLMFVPGGQVVGAGILIGAATSAGVGLATGNFDPRQVAIGGAIGGISGGVGSVTTSTTSAILTGGVLGGGQDLASQALSGQPIDWGSVGVNTLVGGLTGGIGNHLKPVITTGTRAAIAGGVTEGAADVTKQALTGDGTINWSQVAISAGGGAGGGALTHHFSPDPATLGEPSQLALPPAPQRLALEAGAPPDTITVYRGTGNQLELDIRQETGLVMSDAGRAAYMGAGQDVDIANHYSDLVHERAVNTWGSEGDYVEAHGAFGHEIEAVSGERSMVSVTTDPDVAQRFAGKDGIVLRAEVPRDSLLPQTLASSNESEYLARSSIPMEPTGR